MYIKFFITYKKFLIDDIIFFYVNIKFYKRRLTSQVKIKKCAKKVALAFREIFFKRSKCLRNGGNSSNLPFQLVEMRFSWNAHFATNRAGSAALFFGGGPWRSHGSHVRHWCNIKGRTHRARVGQRKFMRGRNAAAQTQGRHGMSPRSAAEGGRKKIPP